MTENTELTVPQESTDIIPQTPPTQNLLQNTKALAMINRLADRYANSSMVPDTYKGKPDNCFVALELASRMDVSPVLVMQNLYIVQGKPSWAGQACKALIDGSGKFTDGMPNGEVWLQSFSTPVRRHRDFKRDNRRLRPGHIVQLRRIGVKHRFAQ